MRLNYLHALIFIQPQEVLKYCNFQYEYVQTVEKCCQAMSPLCFFFPLCLDSSREPQLFQIYTGGRKGRMPHSNKKSKRWGGPINGGVIPARSGLRASS